MSVLVTGGAGYIGSHMVLELLDAGEKVVVIDNLSTGFRLGRRAWGCARCRRHRRYDRVKETIRAHGVTAIIHFAGSIVVPDSVVDPLGYYLNNTVKSRGLMAAAVETGIENFIFSSTAAVYGIPKENPVTRGCALAPMSPYGSSKLMTEIMLGDTLEGARLPLCGAPLFQRRRRRPEGPVGQSTPRRNAPHQGRLRDRARQTHHMEVFGTDYQTPDGTCIRDYIQVSDLVRAHIRWRCSYLRDGGESEMFNCGYSKGFSVLRGDRRREAHFRRRLRSRAVAAPRRRSSGHRRGFRQDPRARSAGGPSTTTSRDHGAGAGLGQRICSSSKP